MPKILYLLSMWMFISGALQAQLKLPALFSDGMVLQQKSNVPVWGWAAPGKSISVTGSWNNLKLQTISAIDGKWLINLPTPVAGGPFNVVIKADESIMLQNVLIGEVWICAGQSNMEMPLKGWQGQPVDNSLSEIANANYTSIRLFTVNPKIAFRPQPDVAGKWESCSPATVASFSATAYFFGRELYNKLHVPIGLIHASWGGTVAEAWTSQSSLKTMPYFIDGINRVNLAASNLKQMQLTDSMNSISWENALLKNDAHNAIDSAHAEWNQMLVPSVWESNGLQIDGIVWFKRVIDIPKNWLGKPLTLELGPIDDKDITYFNGRVVGSTLDEGMWMQNRKYTISPDFFMAGNNLLAVKVIDNGGGGGIFGKPQQLKLYQEGSSDTLWLSGNWNYKVAAVKPPFSTANNPNQPAVLFNGMIAPLIPFSIKGVIWYQGESNVGRAKQYAKLFPLLINDWRKKWKQPDFPFYFVQIAPYHYGGDGTAAAALRDAQRRSLSATVNTGMVVTLDIGDSATIHPSNKAEVGRRLSLWALNKVYRMQEVKYAGPLYKGFKVSGNQVVVSFYFADGGLTSNGKLLEGFEVKDKSGHWFAANARIEGDNVWLTLPIGIDVAAVRYAFTDEPNANLFNKNKLPASSFTSDSLK